VVGWTETFTLRPAEARMLTSASMLKSSISPRMRLLTRGWRQEESVRRGPPVIRLRQRGIAELQGRVQVTRTQRRVHQFAKLGVSCD